MLNSTIDEENISIFSTMEGLWNVCFLKLNFTFKEQKPLVLMLSDISTYQ
jgi:hypothetical protein